MTSLFQLGDFTLNSGATSRWKLECDALTNDDIHALAEMIHQLVGAFGSVEGVPRGGLRLAEALTPHIYDLDSFGPLPHLIVDDVLTTGGSMERLRAPQVGPWGQNCYGATVIGVVVFARGPCPDWIKPLFQMPPRLWIKK